MLIARSVLGILMLALLTAFAPPSGRPPIGPLERYEPKLYDLTFAVGLGTMYQPDPEVIEAKYNLKNAPIVFPVVFLGTYSKVDAGSIKAELSLEGRKTPPNLEMKDGFPFNTHLATMTIREFRGQSLRWQIGYRVQVWSSRINDERAARITWPKEWPQEVQDGLTPQLYIESDDPIFARAVEKVSKGQLRLVPPYLAAKEIVRYCINEVQSSGSANIRDQHGALRGMVVEGAKYAAQKQRGTDHDLVCVCVAMLRATGIPARAVIGVHENDKSFGLFVSWGEFYLPDAGWVPFDPAEMRGKGVRNMDVRRPWPEFGNLDELNERIPLGYHFLPSATIESPRNPAAWGWDPRPGRDHGSDQQIYIDIVSRGKGIEDPQ